VRFVQCGNYYRQLMNHSRPEFRLTGAPPDNATYASPHEGSLIWKLRLPIVRPFLCKGTFRLRNKHGRQAGVSHSIAVCFQRDSCSVMVNAGASDDRMTGSRTWPFRPLGSPRRHASNCHVHLTHSAICRVASRQFYGRTLTVVDTVEPIR
jgi:hypothetical protein